MEGIKKENDRTGKENGTKKKIFETYVFFLTCLRTKTKNENPKYSQLGELLQLTLKVI